MQAPTGSPIPACSVRVHPNSLFQQSYAFTSCRHEPPVENDRELAPWLRTIPAAAFSIRPRRRARRIRGVDECAGLRRAPPRAGVEGVERRLAGFGVL